MVKFCTQCHHPSINARTHTHTQISWFQSYKSLPRTRHVLRITDSVQACIRREGLNLQACMIFFTLKLEQFHKNLFEEHKQTTVYTFKSHVLHLQWNMPEINPSMLTLAQCIALWFLTHDQPLCTRWLQVNFRAGMHKSQVSEQPANTFRMVVLNKCGSSGWNVINVTILVP